MLYFPDDRFNDWTLPNLVSRRLGIRALATNWVLLGKLLGLVILMGLLSYVVLSLQPKINQLFDQLKEKSDQKAIIDQINKLRFKRKKIASICLIVVLITLLLAIQIRSPFSISINLTLAVLIVWFSYRVFKANVPYGWF